MAPLCKFWQQGNCRNGASCRFEHPGANAIASNQFGAPASNRFGALSNIGPSRPQEIPYKINKDSIRADLTTELPHWLLSCFGPGKDAPEQLFGGYPREQSPEEVMLYIRGSSNPQQAESEVAALFQRARQQAQTTVNNLDGAVQFLLAAENKHPNRIDICKQSNVQGSTNGMFGRDAAAGPQAGFANPIASNPFSSTSQQTPQNSQNSFGGGVSAFGQPSVLGQKPNPFGSAPSTTFGQPSAMGASNPVFGQSSQIGAAGPAFGQPSALGQKPNPFSSASPSGPSGFGQATQQSAFGQSSALGQRPSPFGAPAASSVPNAFSQPATPASSSPFSQPVVANHFAQATSAQADQAMDTSAPAPTPAANNPFSQPSASPFNSPAASPFAAQQQPSQLGAAVSNPFAQMQTRQTQPQSQAQNQATPANKGNPYGPNSRRQHPPPETYITKTTNGRITSFNGQQVVYKWKVHDGYQDTMPKSHTKKDPPVPGVSNADGSWRRILFPEGPPGYNKDTEPIPELYNANIQAAYANMTATGRFHGDMPEVPPMREDCVWNF
ncbi:hypothetical protein F4677DRAFT_437326 [Hypoxylon crocopeplum]|nr:hypothetical protein F4677DRAFT_437326 [Hypoxylon crocopeplum]